LRLFAANNSRSCGSFLSWLKIPDARFGFGLLSSGS